MFIMFENDDAEIFNRNNDMVYDRTVDGWMSEELMKANAREQQWKTLANASAKKSKNSKKSKKSNNWKSSNNAKTANNPKPSNETSAYKPHSWICTGKHDEQIVERQEATIAFKPHLWMITANNAQTTKPKKNDAESQTDRDVQEMLESGYTDAHYQLNFDTDDEEEEEEDWEAESQVVDLDAGVTIRQRRDSMGEDWVTESDRTIEEFRLDMRTLDMRLRMRGIEPRYPQHPRSVKPLRLA
ncbi:hypothetical protein MHBO_003671 [Bonamia ostreae]|uniref:Uncharacterized protein n=1 Tax=Bonamia ostreae TaxID=126728 RepID=A0ABV2AR58_9EUKA